MSDSDVAVLSPPEVDVPDQADAAVAEPDAAVAEPDLGYRVEIDAFSGPLDLLLYLVRRAEVDIHDIPIATITDQFISTIRAWDEMDLDMAGDFILMAATLLEIKSRSIAPVEEAEQSEDDDEIIDPRTDLVRQLLAFRACKGWVENLEDCQAQHLQRHRRRFNEDIPEAPEDEDGFDLENADPYQLFKIWDKILGDIAGKGPRTVLYDDIPIADRVRQIESTMREASEGQLSWLMQGVDGRIQRVGIFVALLNCVRRRSLEAIQHEQYADVYLHWVEETRRQMPALELPPESDTSNDDPDGKKKRRRRGPIQLMTYHAAIEDEGEQACIAEVEELIVETEDDRFRRQLEEQTRCDSVLGVMKDFDSEMHEHLVLRGICCGPLLPGAEIQAGEVVELPDEEVVAVLDSAADESDPVTESVTATGSEATADCGSEEAVEPDVADESELVAVAGEVAKAVSQRQVDANETD